ncbi:PREDICTED: bifunctional nuclease isoform X2 [Nelumbo nucifera]|uniref:BFN domain-containing protein n=2 Tax=Nelumbo nucifera TaxID=4432 RepID=A0A822ZPE4_NELNU|nr:PREDICTED: bifunctional nuclease isoform X2 [Nelumbo nucifera]DAD46683.1 TPA_asm: hypothetical protein HUJ06_016620 [Nelumbo nucifera]
MLGIQFHVRTLFGMGASSIDQANAGRSISNSLSCSSSPLSFQLGCQTRKSHGSKSFVIYCKASRRSFGGKSNNDGKERDGEYLEAFIMVSETTRHYQLRRQGFVEETKWQSSGQLLPFPIKGNQSKADLHLVGHGFLRRFQNPTIFLKVSCDGDFLLPIIVGEFAVEKLIDAFKEDINGHSPDQFQFVRNLVEKLDYEVKMVRITERVVNTYYARIYFSKPGEKLLLSVDARPSDAINIAKRCKVPIYVNRQIVLSDAIRILYGAPRGNNVKSVYDVSLDSAADGPDLLAGELNMVKNMNLAVKEERYKDAAMWRDRLSRLWASSKEP